MNFSERLETLQEHVVATKTAVEHAAEESRDQIKQRVDEAQTNIERVVERTQQQADQSAEDARSKWAQVKADAAAKREDVKAKISERTRRMDARMAAGDADWTEADADEALSFAVWAVDNAQLAMLNAIDARTRADELAQAAASS
ncbi:hypothetical protein ACPPVO_43265 [Dactylosporangium sp. McL0621]|uniref:hypothetical protein n=1 Tax=Dactylosporangium sp. McL0621 TaxID=3415678 RepID=UPI003CECC442